MTASLSEFFCLHRRNLLANLVFRNFKVKYRGSALGYLWTLGVPFLQVMVFYFLYQVILKIPVPHYLAFIVTGIFPWVFFSSTVGEGLDSLVTGQNLLMNLPVPLQAFPAASVISNFISFVLALPILAGVLVFSGLPVTVHALWFIPLSLALFLFTYSLAFIMACAYVRFRDLKHMFAIVIQLWMYFTPVLYSAKMIPPQYQWALYANPMAPYFIAIRDILIEGHAPDPLMLWLFTGWTVVFFVIANMVRVRSAGLVEQL